jgi:hypothetical protein
LTEQNAVSSTLQGDPSTAAGEDSVATMPLQAKISMRTGLVLRVMGMSLGMACAVQRQPLV